MATVADKELESKLDYPMTQKSLAIDHWLIAQAAACLEKYRRANGSRIRNRDAVIARLFEAAFGGFRSEESVHIELRRQRKPGGVPEFNIPDHVPALSELIY